MLCWWIIIIGLLVYGLGTFVWCAGLTSNKQKKVKVFITFLGITLMAIGVIGAGLGAYPILIATDMVKLAIIMVFGALIALLGVLIKPKKIESRKEKTINTLGNAIFWVGIATIMISFVAIINI